MTDEAAVWVDCACEVGEGPLWHAAEQRLYWVDIPAGRLYWHTPGTGETGAFDAGSAVGGFTIQADGALLLFMARGAVRLWRAGQMTDVIRELPDELDNRFNDVVADPEGRVFCGTMSTPSRAGRLYRLDPDRTLTRCLDGVGTSNGIGFTPDRCGLYYTDTRRLAIDRFDYDRASGAITNRRVFVRVPEEEGHADGLTVDAEGCVWSARWGGGCVVRYSPDAEPILRLRLPVPRVSSLTFGGPDYTDLFVTTAGGNDRAQNGPQAGSVFRANLGIRGVPEFVSRIAIP